METIVESDNGSKMSATEIRGKPVWPPRKQARPTKKNLTPWVDPSAQPPPPPSFMHHTAWTQICTTNPLRSSASATGPALTGTQPQPVHYNRPSLSSSPLLPRRVTTRTGAQSNSHSRTLSASPVRKRIRESPVVKLAAELNVDSCDIHGINAPLSKERDVKIYKSESQISYRKNDSYENTEKRLDGDISSKTEAEKQHTLGAMHEKAAHTQPCDARRSAKSSQGESVVLPQHQSRRFRSDEHPQAPKLEEAAEKMVSVKNAPEGKQAASKSTLSETTQAQTTSDAASLTAGDQASHVSGAGKDTKVSQTLCQGSVSVSGVSAPVLQKTAVVATAEVPGSKKELQDAPWRKSPLVSRKNVSKPSSGLPSGLVEQKDKKMEGVKVQSTSLTTTLSTSTGVATTAIVATTSVLSKEVSSASSTTVVSSAVSQKPISSATPFTPAKTSVSTVPSASGTSQDKTRKAEVAPIPSTTATATDSQASVKKPSPGPTSHKATGSPPKGSPKGSPVLPRKSEPTSETPTTSVSKTAEVPPETVTTTATTVETTTGKVISSEPTVAVSKTITSETKLSSTNQKQFVATSVVKSSAVPAATTLKVAETKQKTTAAEPKKKDTKAKEETKTEVVSQQVSHSKIPVSVTSGVSEKETEETKASVTPEDKKQASQEHSLKDAYSTKDTTTEKPKVKAEIELEAQKESVQAEIPPPPPLPPPPKETPTPISEAELAQPTPSQPRREIVYETTPHPQITPQPLLSSQPDGKDEGFDYIRESVSSRIRRFEKQGSQDRDPSRERQVAPARPVGPWVKKTSAGPVQQGSWDLSPEESDWRESPEDDIQKTLPQTQIPREPGVSSVSMVIAQPPKDQRALTSAPSKHRPQGSQQQPTLVQKLDPRAEYSAGYFSEDLRGRPYTMPTEEPPPASVGNAEAPKPSEDERDALFDPWCDPKNPRVIHFQDVSAAAFKIKSGIMNTPCNRSHMSAITGVEIFFKKEFNQYTGSFKERGARYTLLCLSEEQRKYGVIAASAGNHALALSYHGKELGIPVTVVMPLVAPIMKVQACRQYGANVIVRGHDICECKEIAFKIAKEKSLLYINGYDHPQIIAGQGTLGLEIVEQVPNIDAVVIPVGGGGLIAGVSLAVKSLYPHIQVIGVESERCASFSASLKAKRPVYVKAEPTLADGLAVPLVGINAFATASPLIDKMVSVKEEWIAISILRLVELEKAVVEGAGAAALAAILAGQLPELKGKKVVIPLCGGNIDTTILGRCLERGLAADGRLVKFAVTVSDRPGGIAELTRLLANLGVSIKDMLHERAWIRSDIFSVEVKVLCETRDFDHFQELKRVLTSKYKKCRFADLDQVAKEKLYTLRERVDSV